MVVCKALKDRIGIPVFLFVNEELFRAFLSGREDW